jgi:hypothetical protein
LKKAAPKTFALLREATMKLRVMALLLLATLAQALAMSACRAITPGACKTVAGLVNLSADNGIMLHAGKVGYQIDNVPKSLIQGTTMSNLMYGISGTFRICATSNHDRFGEQIVNIVSYTNLSFDSPPS